MKGTFPFGKGDTLTLTVNIVMDAPYEGDSVPIDGEAIGQVALRAAREAFDRAVIANAEARGIRPRVGHVLHQALQNETNRAFVQLCDAMETAKPVPVRPHRKAKRSSAMPMKKTPAKSPMKPGKSGGKGKRGC